MRGCVIIPDVYQGGRTKRKYVLLQVNCVDLSGTHENEIPNKEQVALANVGMES